VVIGRSGCGKTTMLRILGGLLAPSSGRVAIDEAQLYDDRFNLQGIVKPSDIYAWAEHLENAARNMKSLARYVEHLEGSEGWE
jgi:ABC-type nitrate/sulfonate/bicarbonate transport system ATPase subunit